MQRGRPPSDCYSSITDKQPRPCCHGGQPALSPKRPSGGVGAAACTTWTIFTEIEVAAALIGWAPDNLPDAPGTPELLQKALGLDDSTVARLDPVALEAYNARTATALWTAIKQSTMQRVLLLPLDPGFHVRRPGPVRDALCKARSRTMHFRTRFRPVLVPAPLPWKDRDATRYPVTGHPALY